MPPPTPLALFGADPRLHGLPHVADLLTDLLDVSVLIPLHKAAASGSVRLLERVVSRDQSDPSVPRSLFRHRLARALKVAIERDDVLMVQRIHGVHSDPLDVRSLDLSLEFGSLEMVQWMVENRYDRRCCLPGIHNLCKTCVYAALPRFPVAMRDADRVIPWLFDAGLSFELEPVDSSAENLKLRPRAESSMVIFNCFGERKLFSEAQIKQVLFDIVAYGSPDCIDVLRHLLGRPATVDESKLVIAMTLGSVRPELEPILELVVNSPLCDPFRDKFVCAPIRPGGIKVLQWEARFMKTAPCFHYATVQRYLEFRAGSHGHEDMVIWLTRVRGVRLQAIVCVPSCDNACVLAIYTLLRAAGVDVATKRVMFNAAKDGRLELIQWLSALGYETEEEAMDIAAKHGHMQMLQWMHENNFGRCTSAAMDEAAENGHLEVVRWLATNRSEGCTYRALSLAAQNGHYDVVKWLLENRGEGDMTLAMGKAAANGHIEVLSLLDGACIDCVARELFRNPLRFPQFSFDIHIDVRDSLLWMQEQRHPRAHWCWGCMPFG